MRVFAAVWPDDDVLDHLDLALGALRGRPAGRDDAIRWSARETWHLTTAFYGSLADGAVPALEAALEAAAAGLVPYPLTLRGAGVFSHRTLWVGAGGDVDAHRRLTRACVEAGDEAGARPDERVRDRPHLTIGRVRPGARPPRHGGSPRPRGGAEPPDPGASVVRALAVYEGPTWCVQELALVESRPGEGRGGGPLYATIATFPLSGR